MNNPAPGPWLPPASRDRGFPSAPTSPRASATLRDPEGGGTPRARAGPPRSPPPLTVLAAAARVAQQQEGQRGARRRRGPPGALLRRRRRARCEAGASIARVEQKEGGGHRRVRLRLPAGGGRRRPRVTLSVRVPSPSAAQFLQLLLPAPRRFLATTFRAGGGRRRGLSHARSFLRRRLRLGRGSGVTAGSRSPVPSAPPPFFLAPGRRLGSAALSTARPAGVRASPRHSPARRRASLPAASSRLPLPRRPPAGGAAPLGGGVLFPRPTFRFPRRR